MFSVQDASDYGVPCAVMLNHFEFWIHNNRVNGRHQHEGRTWCHNSVKALTETFPYMTEDQIRRALEKLVASGVLMKSCLSDDKRDRTSWYAFINEDERLFAASIRQKSQIPFGTEDKSLYTDKNTDKTAALAVLAYLNDKAGKSFKAVKANVKLIQDRLKDYNEDELRAVIDDRVLAWKGDEKMDQYLRPATLFAAKNCSSYHGNLGKTKPANRFAGGV